MCSLTRKHIVVPVGLAACLGLMGSSLAAESASDAPEARSEALVEIVVSARKYDESLRDVPIAISAFSANDIEDHGMVSVEDIARFTPSFSFHSAWGRSPSFDRPSMRGITTILNGVAGTKSISTFIDGVYIGGAVSNVELANLERVEVLKGPQSALYGRGTYAGAINYVTKQPGDQLKGEVSITAAQHKTYAGTVWASGPIVPGKLKFFIGGGHDEYGGEYRNLRDGSTVGSQETDTVVGKLLFTPVDDLAITLKLGYQSTDDGHFPIALLPRTMNNCCFRTPTAPRARESYVGTVPDYREINLYTDLLDQAGGAGNRIDRFSSSLKLVWDFAGGYTLTSNTGYIDDKAEEFFDASYGGYDPLLYSVASAPPFLRATLCRAFGCGAYLRIANYNQKDKSTELRLSSPLDRKLRWTAGFYYYEGEKHETRDDRITTPNIYGVTAGQILGNDDLNFDSVENTAAFGGLEWDFTDKWTGTAEVRWASDDVRVTNVTDQPMLPTDPPAFTPKPGRDFRQSFDSVTPRFTLRYRPNEDFSYYANVSKGTKPGAFNASVPNLPNGQPDESWRAVDEEEVWSYELGMKSRLLDGRMSFSAAAYAMDITNQQLTTVIQLPSGSTFNALTNVGKTEIKGLEAEMTALLTENLTLSVTYSYTDSEFKEYINADAADLRGSNGTFADNERYGDISGNKTPRIPENMASIFLRYDRALTDKVRGYISGDVTYESSRYAESDNLAESGDQTLVGVRLGLNAGNWNVEVFGKNIFDDLTPVDVLRYIDTRYGILPSYPADPVTGAPNSVGAAVTPRGYGIVLPRGSQWGVTAKYRF